MRCVKSKSKAEDIPSFITKFATKINKECLFCCQFIRLLTKPRIL